MISIKKTIRNIKFRMLLLIIISFISSVYCMFDYLSVVPLAESGLNMYQITYHIFDFVPGDGIISNLEYVLFYNFIPCVCFIIILGILFDFNRKEKTKA
jgi:hypothetical protein